MPSEPEIRAVLDTNVFLRLILSDNHRGVAGALFQLHEQRCFQLVTSEPLLEELDRLLRHPNLHKIHQWSSARTEQYLQSLRATAVITPHLLNLDLPELSQRDSSDLPFVVAALEGQAGYLVSQDPDLLDLKAVGNVRILDPLAFLRELRERFPREPMDSPPV